MFSVVPTTRNSSTTHRSRRTTRKKWTVTWFWSCAVAYLSVTVVRSRRISPEKNTLIKSERWPTNPFTPTRNCCTWELISRARQSIIFTTKFFSSLLLKEVKSHAHQLWLGTWWDVGWPVSGSPLWSPHGLAEGICRIRVTDLQWTESYTVYLGVLFLSKLSNHPDFFGIAPILLDWSVYEVPFFRFKWLQCVKILKNNSSACYRIWWAT